MHKENAFHFYICYNTDVVLSMLIKAVLSMDVLKHIDELLAEREWNYSILSKKSGVSESTISNFRKRGNVPTIATLESICAAFGITLSQFFMEDESTAVLTNEQRQLIESWNSLTTAQKYLLNELIKEFK